MRRSSTTGSLAPLRPPGLGRLTAFPNDVLDPAQCHGDLLLQVCAPQPERAAAATDELGAALGDAARVRWRIDGTRRDNGVTAAGRFVDRNHFGFREGASNPDVGDAAEMDRVVWTRGEPAWTRGGTYQVVRLIRMSLALWTIDPVSRQEAVFGRRKTDGAPLGRTAEEEDPGYGYGDGFQADLERGFVTVAAARRGGSQPVHPALRREVLLRPSGRPRRLSGTRHADWVTWSEPVR